MSNGKSTAGGSLGGDYDGRRRITAHLIAAVLLVVLARSVHLAFAAEGVQPRTLVEQTAPRTPFELYDRHGQALALSVECFDLTVSPRALWRTHTPDHLAQVIGGVLQEDPSALLERLLPMGVAPGSGLVVPAHPRLLRFDAQAVPQVQEWLRRGSLDPEADPECMAGWQWVVLEDKRYATLAWQPEVVLSENERVRHLGPNAKGRPERWTARLLGDLATLVRGFGLPSDVTEDMHRMAPYEQRAYLADAIWAELCPTTFRVVQKGVDPLSAHELAKLLKAETVSPWQVQLKPSLQRFQPVRSQELGMLPMGAGEDEDAFGVLGHWGVLGADDAMAQARLERDTAPHRLPWDQPGDPVLARAQELASQWKPWSGVERLCSSLLDQSGLEREWRENARSYEVRARRVARDRRLRWPDREVPDYLEGYRDADPMVELHSTLDSELQVELHSELLRVMDRFDPALAMGICIEVETGKVLAVDGLQAYPGARFLPTQHVFTPGSTFKAVIMAAALDRGVVRPEEQIETFAPRGIVVQNGKSRRLIKEAEGAPNAARITASEGLALSVNAVLVQIGLRLDPADLRGLLIDLGYGSRPDIGLGPEHPGYLPPLVKGT
ncbi:MAG TPA: penicillin-binding transpeptidase domain-containing protein, partial [Planctomycetota bacterium]|nr:penicillin-binding transpeptidase domain-containing protein [Planctomycetota bacterium]